MLIVLYGAHDRLVFAIRAYNGMLGRYFEPVSRAVKHPVVGSKR